MCKAASVIGPHQLVRPGSGYTFYRPPLIDLNSIYQKMNNIWITVWFPCKMILCHHFVNKSTETCFINFLACPLWYFKIENISVLSACLRQWNCQENWKYEESCIHVDVKYWSVLRCFSHYLLWISSVVHVQSHKLRHVISNIKTSRRDGLECNPDTNSINVRFKYNVN